MAQAADEEQPVAVRAAAPLLAERGQGPDGGLLPVAGGPPVVGLVIGAPDRRADEGVQVEGPQPERRLAYEGPLDEPQRGRFLGQSRGLGGQG
ncbi:hypothetical protein ACFPK5_01125 [Streptomyces beijiangensis]|uniref:hypothetical protein n=1 Tax=Streptomyces beijiangensis TaxID=163361 RepID=UPI00361A7FC1